MGPKKIVFGRICFLHVFFCLWSIVILLSEMKIIFFKWKKWRKDKWDFILLVPSGHHGKYFFIKNKINARHFKNEKMTPKRKLPFRKSPKMGRSYFAGQWALPKYTGKFLSGFCLRSFTMLEYKKPNIIFLKHKKWNAHPSQVVKCNPFIICHSMVLLLLLLFGRPNFFMWLKGQSFIRKI
jgi:hypothetical protein